MSGALLGVISGAARRRDAAAWSLLELSPALWLDAQDGATITLVSDAVSEWADKSGNSRHATQDTSEQRPAYLEDQIGDFPAVVFNGTSHNLTSSTGTYETPLSIFAIARATLTGGYRRILNIGANNDARGAFGQLSGNFTTIFGNGSTWNDIAANTPSRSVTSDRLLVVVNPTSGSNATPYVDGEAQNTKNGAMLSSTGVRIGRNGVFAGQLWGGPIGELVVFPSALSSADREKVEGYLAHKWGLAGNLPSGHPYKSTPP